MRLPQLPAQQPCSSCRPPCLLTANCSPSKSHVAEVIQNIRGYDGKMADVWSAGEPRLLRLSNCLLHPGL